MTYDYDDDSDYKITRRHSTDLNSLIIVKMKPIGRLRRDQINGFKVVRVLFAFARQHGYSISFGTLSNNPDSGKNGISIIISNINHSEFRRAMRMVKAIMQSFLWYSVSRFVIIGWKNRFRNTPTKVIYKG